MARLSPGVNDVFGKEQGMLDVVLLAGGIGFFIISIAYAYGCDRL
jgi:hypothetical protein